MMTYVEFTYNVLPLISLNNNSLTFQEHTIFNTKSFIDQYVVKHFGKSFTFLEKQLQLLVLTLSLLPFVIG